MIESAFTIDIARGIVDKIFSTRVSRAGLLTRVDEGQELVPDALFSFTMLNEVPLRHGVQLFKGLGSVGEALWQHELRSLRCLSALREAGLPHIVEGNFHEPDDVAYVITETSDLTLASPGVMAFMAATGHEAVALKQLRVLLSALRRIHARGLLHRNIVPDAIEALQDPRGDDAIALRLGGFEMSSLVANLVRRQIGVREVTDRLRARAAAVASFTAPERLAFVHSAFGPLVDDWRGDVYGLGMLAYCWFVLKGMPGPEEAIDANTTRAELLVILERRGQRTQRAGLPSELRELIRGMLTPDWRKRLTAHEAYELLHQRGLAIESAFERKPRGARPAPLLVSFAPDGFDNTLVLWAGLSKPGDTASQLELRMFIEGDLCTPFLTYTLDGYARFSDEPNSLKHQQAKYILVGSEYLYFCAPYNPGFGGTTYPEILHICYVLPRRLSAVGRLVARSVLMPLPRLEPAPMSAATTKRAGRSSWQPLLDRVSRLPTVREKRVLFEEAIDWLLEVAEARLLTRQYPYGTCEDLGEGTYALGLNAALNRKRRNKLSILNACDRVQPPSPFASFFQALDTEILHVWPAGEADDFRPRRNRAARAVVRFLDGQGQDRIIVSLEEGTLPARGWVMPADDEGSFEILVRQRRARDELFDMDLLIDQLQRPRAVFTERSEWKNAGAGLSCTARRVLDRMLNAWPFFAVHGPPGTGKTTLTARAVAAVLGEDKSRRILVSAQSHDSLDNIAERVLSTLTRANLEGEVNVMRVASPSTEDRVSKEMQKRLPRQMAEGRRAMIQQHIDKTLASTTDETLRSILGRWRSQCETGVLEIADRLRRGANVVFATCGSATQRNLSVLGADDVFDWVIIEEAAKAWPTELAIPLVRGASWTLIGDHLQLKAFGRDEIQQILKACQSSHDRLLRERTENGDAFVQAFDLFANIFDGWDPDAPATPGQLERSCGALNTQYRMALPIGTLVGEAFYRKRLATSEITERPHGITAPVLAHRHLLWIDTGRECQEVPPRWKNPEEARVVRDLLRAPAWNPDPELSVAVLTPYWQQVYALRKAFGVNAPAIETADSFQGKEADIVILSLVRSNSGSGAPQRIGFLGDPARVNVMCSRARRLLIVVGDFEHFAETPSIWTEVTRLFKKYGRKEYADGLVKALGGRHAS